jgi:lipoate-protein ligase A
MARDESMLDLVAGDPSSAAFRTYGWTEPTLSLGYFQAVAGPESDPRWRGVPLVRRPTGGGAILHHREVTYALVIPRSHALALCTAELYLAVHASVAALLGGERFGVRRRGDPGSAVERERRPFLCFNDRDPEDLVVGSHKVVGSAQRRRAGAVLQHGSVLLAASPLTPELPGLSDLTAAPADTAFWAERLSRRFPEALGLQPEPSGWPEPLLARARVLEAGVYRNLAWTRRR